MAFAFNSNENMLNPKDNHKENKKQNKVSKVKKSILKTGR